MTHTEEEVSTHVAASAVTRIGFRRSLLYLLGYGIVYSLLLLSMHRRLGFEWAEPLMVLGVLGCGFSALAWWVTRNSTHLPFAVKRPTNETALLLTYLLPLTAYLTWGRGALARATIPEPTQSLVILGIKLLLFVGIPAMLLGLGWGYRGRELFPLASPRSHMQAALWMSVVLVAFQCIFGRGLGEIRQSGLAPATLIAGVPLVYLLLLLEVGLVEEFFFRVLLQSRLALWLRSEVGGIVVMALLFGLAHAPGLYYRSGATQEAVGTHPSWLMAIGYSIVITSVAGFFLGVLWARTRNLLLLMIVHAAGDFIPNFVSMLKTWI